MQSEPIDCAGYVIETAITDSIGRTRFQHSPIYRRRADAERLAHLPCKLALPSEDIRRTVIMVRTCFPASDVVAGNATLWEEALATASEASVPPMGCAA